MELFVSVARTGNFTETARSFGMSATSVSRMITELEDHLQVRLLQRSTRHVALSEAGQAYAARVEKILWSVRDIEGSVAAISAEPAGVLRVHSRMLFGLQVVTPLLPEFRARYPDITIELLLGENPVDLRRQQVDIDLRIAPPAETGLRRRMLFMSERFLVASPDYLRLAGPLETPSDLSGHACLAYHLPGSLPVWRFRNGDATLDEIPVTPRFVSNNGLVLLQMARMGEGIALLDDYTVAQDLDRGSLLRVLPGQRVSNTTFDDGMYATFLDIPGVGSAGTPAKIRVFIDFIAERVAGAQRRFGIVASHM